MSAIALAVSQAFAAHVAADDAVTPTVVVTGMKASARSSVAIKRDAMEVVDSITAEDIGKLPDPNVAETLTRIPGVQGYRYGGEGAAPVGNGSGLTIRGLSGQTASLVNGRAFFSAGNREYNIESAIPGMIAGVDVYKNPSAEHIEGGIGGLVNVRTRNPSDFKLGLTGAISAGARYNDLAKQTEPDVFGLIANRIDLGGGSRFGYTLAGQLQNSTNRSDNNPGNRGPALKRAVRADSAEYATLAAANTTNSPFQAQAQFVGRSDINALINVPIRNTAGSIGPNTPDNTGLTQAQIDNIMVTTTLNTNVSQETIMRERKGFSGAADYRVDNTLRFYVESNYTYYLYHQNYRALNSNDGVNVANLQTSPFTFDKGMSARNVSGGANDVLATKRALSGDFLNSTVNTVSVDEHTPYSTWNVAFGSDWNPTPSLALKADYAFLKATKRTDNRTVFLDSKNGLSWTTSRVADGSPHTLNFSGPSLSDPSNFVFREFNNGNNSASKDSAKALALSGVYSIEDGLFKRIKFGTRLAKQDDLSQNWSYNNRPLTTDGKGLAADRSNGILASTYGVTQSSPTNFMGGTTGYSGGYVVYSPDLLLGDQVRSQFPLAGIQMESALLERIQDRRYVDEKTKAIYVVGEFAALDEHLRGAVGVRYVRTNGTAITKINSVNGLIDNARTTEYSNTLPSFNATYDISKETLLRFGYGRGMTRAALGDLNPFVNYNPVDGTGSRGNPELKPLVSDNLDLSLEHYFNKTNYVAAAVFNKSIKGFFSDVSECVTLDNAPAYVPGNGQVSNSCTNGQYRVSKRVNAEKGFARGVELSGQYFFDNSLSWLKNFGVSGSYTYVTTENPVNYGTAAAPNIVKLWQPFQSKNSASFSGMYEDQKFSARLVYTWRSAAVFALDAQPILGRYMGAYGILDGSVNYNITKDLTLSLNASNILDKAPNRYIGEPGGNYETGLELQHYRNGRNFGLNLRYRFGQ
ncbi:MAG: TonB-dependent receptor [Massilia sp.]